MPRGIFTLKQQLQSVQQKSWVIQQPLTYGVIFNNPTGGGNRMIRYSITAAGPLDISTTTTYTIESWILWSANTASTVWSWNKGTTDQSYYNLSWSGLSTEFLKWEQLNTTGGSLTAITTTFTPVLHNWYHISVVRSGSAITVYVNGRSVGTGSYASNDQVFTELDISAHRTSVTPGFINFHTGIISNFRLVKGTAVYTANFSPPTSPLTAISGTALLTCQSSTLIDNSGNGFTGLDGTIYSGTNGSNPVVVAPFTQFTQLAPPAVDYLVVAGGGAGGGSYGSGGGAGGLLQGSTPVIAGSAITVTVGAGGTGVAGANGNSGNNSVLGNITAFGGGYGLSGYGGQAGSGGSGGGGSGNITGHGRWGQGTFGQGNAGGDGGDGTGPAQGGGGGAGTPGLNGFSEQPAGNGGAGIASAITGTVTGYAGGGGGGCYNRGGTGYQGAGGFGGGGAGGATNVTTNGTAGTANTGGGGGGSSYVSSGSPSGGNGGSGIVVISYSDVYAGPIATTGSPTVSSSGAGSMYFSGTANQYMSATNSNLNLGTGDFTIEMWAYISDLSSLRIWFSGGNNIYIQYNPTTNYLMYQNATTSMFQLISANVASLLANIWTHIVVVRSGTTISLFSNGIRYATNASNSQAVDCSSFVWGAYNQAPNLYNPTGYFTNLRITNTAVYNPSLTTLTVPTAPLTPITGTKLLLNTVSGSYFADSSTSGITLAQGNISAAVPVWNQASPFATGLGYKNRVYTYTGSGTITF